MCAIGSPQWGRKEGDRERDICHELFLFSSLVTLSSYLSLMWCFTFIIPSSWLVYGANLVFYDPVSDSKIVGAVSTVADNYGVCVCVCEGA